MVATSSPQRTSARNDAGARSLRDDCAAAREEVREVREKMRATVSSARAGLQIANDDLAAVKAYVRKLLDQ